MGRGSVIALFVLVGCGAEGPGEVGGGDGGGAAVPEEWRALECEEPAESDLPPCMRSEPHEVVLTSVDDYEQLRLDYALPGEYVEFDADGEVDTFQLPYQPLDTNRDDAIGPEDLNIYVKDRPLLAEIDGEVREIDADPLRITDGEIQQFSDEPPYTVQTTIPYELVLSVDPMTGAVTFLTPPQSGSRVSIGASATLLDEYEGVACSMDDYDFSQILIGHTATGSGCLVDVQWELYYDEENNRLVQCAHREFEMTESGACPDIAVGYTQWCAVDPPDGDYTVAFADAENGCVPD